MPRVITALLTRQYAEITIVDEELSPLESRDSLSYLDRGLIRCYYWLRLEREVDSEHQ
jgi:hypothetical protein